VIDADQVAREVVAPGTPGLAAVAAEFGRQVLDDANALDRAALAAVVFGDPDARRRLEAIIHPLVRARTAELAAAAPAGTVVVNEVPLIVEAGLADRYDLVIVVLAAEQARLGRLVGARGMTPQQARERMRAQATDQQRRAVADIVITNDGSVEQTLAQVDTVWRERLFPLVGGGGPGDLVERGPDAGSTLGADRG